MRPIDHVLNTEEIGASRKLLKSGAPGEIRTPDLLLRRQSLYPSELRARRSISLQGRRKRFNGRCRWNQDLDGKKTARQTGKGNGGLPPDRVPRKRNRVGREFGMRPSLQPE